VNGVELAHRVLESREGVLAPRGELRVQIVDVDVEVEVDVGVATVCPCIDIRPLLDWLP
jgi:hypothetical protein